MSGLLGINGIISGMNTDEVVRAIMEQEKLPLRRLESKKGDLQARSNAWRELNSRLYKLKDAAYNLQSFVTFRAQKVTVSDDKILTATASAEALLSSYQLNVTSLARAHSVSSTVINDDTQLAGGKIQIMINGESKELEINLEGDTAKEKLYSIIKQINAAGLGVNASMINVSENEHRLFLTSKETGAINELKLADLEGSSLLKDLGVLNEDGEIANQIQAATDAKIEINGAEISRASNLITDLVPGVSLTLKAEGQVALGVELDREKVVDTVKEFVDAYNSVMDYINKHKTFSYNETTKTGNAGELFGDSSLLYIESQMKRVFNLGIEGVDLGQRVRDGDLKVGFLNMVGIQGASGVEGAKSGKLEFNEELFKTKLETNFDEIAKLFGASSESREGVFKTLHDELYSWTSSGGVLKLKTDTIQREISDIDSRLHAMEDRLAMREQYHYAKFAAMEQAMAKLHAQSSWLTAQLGTLNANWKTK